MKPNKLLILCLVVLCTVLQCTVLNYLQILNTKPDILLILVLFFSLYLGRAYALGVGVLCGIFAEATSDIHSGFAILAYSIGALLLAHLARLVYRQRVLGQMLTAFIFTFFVYILLFSLFHTLDVKLPILTTLIFIILPVSLYTACVTPFLFYCFGAVYKIR